MNYYYWQYKGRTAIARQEKHLEEYHDSITDIPVYIVIFFYVFMTLISPKRKQRIFPKDESGVEA